LDFRETALVALIESLGLVHDLGKFALRFQAKAPDVFPDIPGTDPGRYNTTFNHGSALLDLFDSGLCEPLNEVFSANPEVGRFLVGVAAGHHGTPVRGIDSEYLEHEVERSFGREGIKAACECVEALLPGGRIVLPGAERVRHASWLIAGLLTLADWIGSDAEIFPYCDIQAESQLRTYRDSARRKATEAVARIGILPSAPSPTLSLADLVGREVDPRPMQEAISTLALPEGPSLVIIEDDTGSGKSEAALLLAHRFIAR
jgi:CRISPR-associated endonuclease/helicase Cas3